MKSRYLLALLLAAGACAGAPVKKGDVRPTVLPASVFLGNYPKKFREWTQKQWAALPLELRRASPPKFKLITGAEMKTTPGMGKESTGYYDPGNRIVYTRADMYAYHQRFLGHELAGHWTWLEGRDPKSKFPAIMTSAEINDWISWNDKNWQLVPQYCWDIPECNRKKPHESFSQAMLQVYYPGNAGHPNYGRANPQVAAKLRSYFGP